MKSSGVVTSTDIIGSMSTGPARRAASLNAIEPAILKASSEESTSWYGAVPQGHLDVDQRVAGEDAELHGLLAAGVDARGCTRAGCGHR